MPCGGGHAPLALPFRLAKIWLNRREKIAIFGSKCHSFFPYLFLEIAVNFLKKIRKKHGLLNTPTRYWGVRLTNRVFCLFFSESSEQFLKKIRKNVAKFQPKKAYFFEPERGRRGSPKGASKPGFLSFRPYWLGWLWLGPRRFWVRGFGFGFWKKPR